MDDAPAYDPKFEAAAQLELDAHRGGGFFAKRKEARREKLEAAVAHGRRQDNEAHLEAMSEHEAEMAARQLALRVLNFESESYVEALSTFNEMSELAAIGEGIKFKEIEPKRLVAELDAHSDDVIPKEFKSLLKSGKLSSKTMPVTKRWALYQDHVCSASMRLARDVFGILPVEMVKVNVYDELLDSATGHLDRMCVLSVLYSRVTIETLNVHQIDPSDSLSNFVHEMQFQKTKGFKPVEPIQGFPV